MKLRTYLLIAVPTVLAGCFALGQLMPANDVGVVICALGGYIMGSAAVVIGSAVVRRKPAAWR